MATDTWVARTTATESVGRQPEFPPFYRLTVEQYHRIAAAGIIPEGAPVELMEGLLVRKMTVHPPHNVAMALLGRWLHRHIPDGWFVSTDTPIALEEQESEPEPDEKIVRGDPRDYSERMPGPGDVALVVEISDTSYRYDRQVKWANYAAAGVPVYWIVDLNRRVLEIHTEHSPEGYRTVRVLGPDEEAPIVLDGREVARLRVSDILP